MTNRAMTDAYQRGDVIPLSPLLTEFAHFNGDWWTLDPPDAWLRITDNTFANFLDQQHDKLKSVLNFKKP